MSDPVPGLGGTNFLSPLANPYLQALQAIAQKLGENATAITDNLGVPVSGQISGTLPGPIAVNAVTGTTTNNNAAVGIVGEELEIIVPIGSAISLSTGVSKTIGSLILTPGDWDAWAYIGFTGNGSTTVQYLIGSISETTNTLLQTRAQWASQALSGATVFGTLADVQFACGMDRYSVAANTTLYLVAQASFSVSTCSAFGAMIARRRR